MGVMGRWANEDTLRYDGPTFAWIAFVLWLIIPFSIASGYSFIPAGASQGFTCAKHRLYLSPILPQIN